MRVLRRPPVSLTPAQWRLRAARPEDADTFLDEPARLETPDGRAVAVYWPLPPDGRLDAARSALERVPVEMSARVGGLVYRSRVFGYLPRVTIRRDFCTASSLARDYPAEHAALVAAGAVVAAAYRQAEPDIFARHDHLTQTRALPEWRLPGTPFTSGIVNLNNPLAYHTDSGNYPDVWSAMLVFRRDTTGGHLVLPAWRLAFACADRSLFLFDGQSVVHGVTPIVKERPDAYRFSVVYYALRGIWDCLPFGQELARIRQKRAERERRRAAAPPEAPHTRRSDIVHDESLVRP